MAIPLSGDTGTDGERHKSTQGAVVVHTPDSDPERLLLSARRVRASTPGTFGFAMVRRASAKSGFRKSHPFKRILSVASVAAGITGLTLGPTGASTGLARGVPAGLSRTCDENPLSTEP